MTLDQATEDLLVVYSARGRRPIHLSTPESARAAGAQGWLPLGTGTAMCSLREHVVGSIGGEFRVRVLRPAARTSAVVVYLHSGGWLLGDIDGYDALGRILAARSGATVVLANYRKAPEHPFPLPVEDAWAALRWAGEHRASLAGEDVGPVPLIVAGDSAWGSLAAVTALRAREAGGPRISQQPLIYPITDCDRDRPSYLDPANQLLLSADTMAWSFDHYVGEGDRTHPEVSPLRARDHRGLRTPRWSSPATIPSTTRDSPTPTDFVPRGPRRRAGLSRPGARLLRNGHRAARQRRCDGLPRRAASAACSRRCMKSRSDRTGSTRAPSGQPAPKEKR